MATLGAMLDNISVLLARTDLTGSLSATAKLAVARAIDHYKADQFWFTEGRVSFTASAGQAEYTLSASTLAILAVNITLGGSTYPLTQLLETDRAAMNTNTLTGSPNYFSVFGNRFIPYPAPNSTYTVEITCTRDQGTLTATTSSNNWTNIAEALIEARASWWLCQYVFKSYEEAQTFAALEQNALDALRGKDSYKQPNRLTATQF